MNDPSGLRPLKAMSIPLQCFAFVLAIEKFLHRWLPFIIIIPVGQAALAAGEFEENA